MFLKTHHLVKIQEQWKANKKLEYLHLITYLITFNNIYNEELVTLVYKEHLKTENILRKNGQESHSKGSLIKLMGMMGRSLFLIP